jgi:amino acid transporter
VFASDNLSSSAYATEEILHILVPAVDFVAFSLVLPITGALLVMLTLLILSYRETIKQYPSAGGAYLVTRDDFGVGTRMRVEGTVGVHRARLAILNPRYHLLG